MKSIIWLAIIVIFFINCSSDLNHKLSEDYPQWVREAVFYQIFPERFRNGDPSNDPDLHSLLGSYPHDIEAPWQVHPWTSDWYQLQPWEEANGRGFGFNAQKRRYGGDIQGLIDQLDYLQNLGINALYLNPVFESPSLHKYDAATYIHIDDNFGPNPVLDRQLVAAEIPDNPATWKWTSADSLFLKLLYEAHQRGIKIVIDGVFNHVGIRHWAFLDLKQNGPSSRFKEWFTVKAWDDLNTPTDEFTYVGWMNVKELPELKEDENGLISPIKKHVFDIVERWMDPNGDGNPEDGIDGWRLDVAEMVHHNFWKEFRQKVKSINSQAYITGELFWDDWQASKLMDPTPWLQGDEFDGTMNYRWSALLTNFFIDQQNKISVSEFIGRLHDLDQGYPPYTKFVLMNLMDSHDTDRLSSNIVNPDLFYDKMVTLHDNPYYDVRKPRSQEWQILKLIALFQMTYPGAPMIYYGTESGMWGADDPDERKPMVWDDLVYEDEVASISKTPRPRDQVFFDHDLHDYYKKLIHLRKQEVALRRGDFKALYSDDLRDVFAYSREIKTEQILIIINNSSRRQDIVITGLHSAPWTDLWSGEIFKSDKSALKLTVEAKQGKILKRK